MTKCVSEYSERMSRNGVGVCTAERLAALALPLAPCLSLTGRGRGNVGCGSARMLATFQMVAQVRYVPDKKSGFLISF